MNKEKNHIDKYFKDAFNEFEVNPSKNVWKEIVNDSFDKGLRSAFSDFEKKPSPIVWAAIASEYDFDSNINDTFNKFEVIPPPRMWKAISGQLTFDESLNQAFQTFEINPNPEIWEYITSKTIDNRFKTVFSKFESEPGEENWEKIRRTIPVTLFLRDTFSHLSRIAAILVIGFFLTFLVNYSGIFQGSSVDSTIVQSDSKNIHDNKIDSPLANDKNNQTIAKSVEEDIDEIVFIENKNNSLVSPPLEKNNINVSNSSNKPIITDNNAEGNGMISSIPENTLVRDKIEEQFLGAVVSSHENKEESVEIVKVLDKLPEIKDTQIASNLPVVSNLNHLTSLGVTSVGVSEDLSQINFLLTSIAGPGKDLDAEMIKAKNSLISRTDSRRAVSMLNYRGVYILVSGQYSNTWIYNNEVKSKLSELVQADYLMDFGGAVGTGFGIQFTPRFGLEAQWNYTKLNQRYRELIPEGFYINKEASLTYSSFPVLARIQITRVKNNRPNPITSSLVLGAQYRYLKNSKVKEADVEIPQELFLSQELGVVLGWDYNMHLNKNTFLTVGGRAAVGTDVTGLSSLSNDSNYNAEFGIRMALNYKVTR